MKLQDVRDLVERMLKTSGARARQHPQLGRQGHLDDLVALGTLTRHRVTLARSQLGPAIGQVAE